MVSRWARGEALPQYLTLYAVGRALAVFGEKPQSWQQWDRRLSFDAGQASMAAKAGSAEQGTAPAEWLISEITDPLVMEGFLEIHPAISSARPLDEPLRS